MKRAKWVTLLITFAFAAFASSAMANTISIGLQESGTNGGAITTEGSGSGNAAFSGSYGSFNINNVSGTGAPALAQGVFNTNSLNASTGAAGTLTVYVTDQGVTLAGLPGTVGFLSSLTENTLTPGWSVTESTYVDQGNGQYALTTPLSTATFTTGPLTDVLSATASLNSPFSITAVYTIVANGAGSDNSTINVTAAEPGSIALLGLVLLGGLLVERKKLFA